MLGENTVDLLVKPIVVIRNGAAVLAFTIVFYEVQDQSPTLTLTYEARKTFFFRPSCGVAKLCIW